MPPSRRPALLLATSALALTVAACGGSDDAPGSSTDPGRTSSTATTSSAPPSSATAEPSPTTAAADLTGDPCSLLDVPDYAALVDERARDSVAEQISQYGDFMGCRVYWQYYDGLTYGFAVDPDAFDDAVAARPPRAEDAELQTDVPGADRTSVSTRGDGSITVYAEAGGNAFFLAQPGATVARAGLARGSTSEVLAAAAALVAHGTGRISPTPVLLPESCPAVDSTVTSALLGEVEYGRGGSNPQGIAACGYAGADGTRASTEYSFLLPGIFDPAYDDLAPDGRTVVDPKPGVWKAWEQTGDGSFRYSAWYPDAEPQLVLRVEASGITGADAAERFVAWAEAYLATNEPTGQP